MQGEQRDPVTNEIVREAQWDPADEVDYVQHLGTGKWHLGSDMRHNRVWWLKKYLEVSKGMDEGYHQAGRNEAKRLLRRLEK